MWQKNPSEHILVCTPSNAAADVITKRLLEFDIPDHNLYRMYSPSKEGYRNTFTNIKQIYVSKLNELSYSKFKTEFLQISNRQCYYRLF